MLRISILVATLSLVGLAADDMEIYKESSDRYFNENVEKLNNGTLKEKIIAVENLRRIKTKRALRPFILALKGSSDVTSTPKNGVVQPEVPEVDQPLVNVDLPQNNAPALKFLLSQAIADIASERGMPALVEVYGVVEKKVTPNEKVNLPKIEDMNNVNAAGELLRSIGKLIERLENTQEVDGVKYRPVADAVKSGMETLKAGLTHTHYYIRSTAADGLRNTNRPESLNSLYEAIQNEKDDYTKAAILSAIIGLKPNDSEKLFDLAELIKSDRPDVRIRVSIGLAQADVTNAGLYLRHAMQFEENTTVRDQMKRDLQYLNSFRTVDIHTTGSQIEFVGNDSPNSRSSKIYKK